MTSPNALGGARRITAVICTHGRATLAAQAVSSVVDQTLAPEAYEILIVDNASGEASDRPLHEFPSLFPNRRVRTVREPTLGLSHARNTGTRNAQGEFVAFLDDDARATERWLEGILRAFTDSRPAPLAVGGPIFPIYETERPPWYRDEYEIRSWGAKARPLRVGESFSGSNMAFPKRVLEENGGFHAGLGVRGNHLSVGEETHLFERLWCSGDASGRLLYDPKLVVYHVVPAHKMRVSYGLKRAFAAGQSWSTRHPPANPAARVAMLLQLGARLAFVAARAAYRFRRGRSWQAWCIEEIGPAMETLGRLAGYASLSVSLQQDVSDRGGAA
jgi:cellulose synthase/poly-beta-1,6-N-acetylglucosamine synthase-like glycosyltransferase